MFYSMKFFILIMTLTHKQIVKLTYRVFEKKKKRYIVFLKIVLILIGQNKYYRICKILYLDTPGFHYS